MFIMARAVTYAALFIALLLVFAPARILARSGIEAPALFDFAQIGGATLVMVGTWIALSCVLASATSGRGAPAPLDPPRRLVMRGPYGFVRNPMYIGAGVALLGAALFYESRSLLLYAIVFMLLAHLLVVLYEEPTLRSTFGADYERYLRQVRRWTPSLRSNAESTGETYLHERGRLSVAIGALILALIVSPLAFGRDLWAAIWDWPSDAGSFILVLSPLAYTVLLGALGPRLWRAGGVSRVIGLGALIAALAIAVLGLRLILDFFRNWPRII